MLRYAILIIGFIIASCNKSEDAPLTPAEELQMEQLVNSLETFQWDLFQEVVASENTGENLNISPLSIAAALYMTYEGAANETRNKMSNTLKLPNEVVDFNLGQAYKNLMKELEKDGAVIGTANAIFWDKNRIDPNNEFLDYTQNFFNASQYDLVFQEPKALTTINNWVKTSTQNRIEKIIEEISAEEVMFLINALYFKDDWKFPFPEESTRKTDFTLNNGTQIEVDMMHQDISTLKYYLQDDLTAVELPFADTSYGMVLILPPVETTPDQLIASLEGDRLETLLNLDLVAGRIYLEVPRFEIEYKILLNTVLKSMGMELAFDPDQADFSNLGAAPEGNLYISKVNHKTYLKVDEKGAEGAAVTSVGVGVTSAPPVINFNRPFVFLLRNRLSNTLIFAGKIEDPTSK